MFKKKVGEEEAGVVEEGVGDAVVEGEEEEEEEAEVGHEYDVNNTGCAPARINLLMKKYINSKLGQRIGWTEHLIQSPTPTGLDNTVAAKGPI